MCVARVCVSVVCESVCVITRASTLRAPRDMLLGLNSARAKSDYRQEMVDVGKKDTRFKNR